MLNFDPFLCLVTDRSFQPESEFLPILEACLDAGVSWVQFREKAGLSDRATYELGLKVRELTRKKKIPLVVDDRLDLAMAIEADGVHLGQSDLPLDAAKRLWKPGKLWGVSVQTAAQAEFVRNDADYLGVGALFPTTSKEDAVETPHAILADLADFGLPLIGIGGITPERAGSLRRLGCSGVAVISAVWGATDPSRAVWDFIEAWKGTF